MNFLLSFTVPAFKNIFALCNAQLPALTRGVKALSRPWQNTDWSFFSLTVGQLCANCQGWRRQPQLQRLSYGMLLQLPAVGRLIAHTCLAYFSRIFALLFCLFVLFVLFAAFIPFILDISLKDAREAAQKRTGHSHDEAASPAVNDQSVVGQFFAQSMAQHPQFFSVMLNQMRTQAEESGALGLRLISSDAQYEPEMRATSARLGAMVEPLITLCLGLLTGGMVGVPYLPMPQKEQVP